jgi:PadR family transcriptional regulator PadR
MAKGDHVGSFELLVLASLWRLGDAAYGVTIRQEIERRARRSASIGAVHATLARLADKGLVGFHLSEPLPMRGGRARKCARLTAAGRRAFHEAMAEMRRMTEGMEPEPRT